MAINSLTGASSTTTNAASTSSTVANQTIDEAQSRFMKLLVTQMQNQDPLNPMDNADLTTQIAQLNTVTGINQLNSSMQSLLGGFQLQSASLIGRTVLAPGSSLDLADGQATMAMDLAQAADSVQVTVRNSSGQVVRVMKLGAQPAGQQDLSWDGQTDAGASAPDGRYTFSIQASKLGQQVTATTLSFGQVSSVALASGGVSLAIPTLGNVALTDVRQVR